MRILYPAVPTDVAEEDEVPYLAYVSAQRLFPLLLKYITLLFSFSFSLLIFFNEIYVIVNLLYELVLGRALHNYCFIKLIAQATQPSRYVAN